MLLGPSQVRLWHSCKYLAGKKCLIKAFSLAEGDAVRYTKWKEKKNAGQIKAAKVTYYWSNLLRDLVNSLLLEVKPGHLSKSYSSKNKLQVWQSWCSGSTEIWWRPGKQSHQAEVVTNKLVFLPYRNCWSVWERKGGKGQLRQAPAIAYIDGLSSETSPPEENSTVGSEGPTRPSS